MGLNVGGYNTDVVRYHCVLCTVHKRAGISSFFHLQSTENQHLLHDFLPYLVSQHTYVHMYYIVNTNQGVK